MEELTMDELVDMLVGGKHYLHMDDNEQSQKGDALVVQSEE